jgi:hypothetical protein
MIKQYSHWVEVYCKGEKIFEGSSVSPIDLLDVLRKLGRKAEIRFHMNSAYPFRIDFKEDREEE